MEAEGKRQHKTQNRIFCLFKKEIKKEIEISTLHTRTEKKNGCIEIPDNKEIFSISQKIADNI